jgi:sulfur carrier protein
MIIRGATMQWGHPQPRCDDAERSDEEKRRMIILVNAERLEVDDQTTVAALLQSLGYPDRGIAVALDQAVLPRSSWATTLSDGAQIQVVTAVQGG